MYKIKHYLSLANAVDKKYSIFILWSIKLYVNIIKTMEELYFIMSHLQTHCHLD